MDDTDQHDTFPADMQIDGPKRLYNISQAAAWLGLGRPAVRKMIDAGTLKSLKIGARRYVRVAELVRFARGR